MRRFFLFYFFILFGIWNAGFGIFAYAAERPNDPLFPDQWYLQKINAPAAWEATTGSRDVIVAVIDTGIDEDHEDLADNLWVNEDEIAGNGIDDDRNGYSDDRAGWDFVLNEPSANPKFQGAKELQYRPIGAHHGTIVAGLIAAVANNGKGIVGVAPSVRIMNLRALTSSGSGAMRDVVAAIDYAVANDASVINVSFETAVRSTLVLQAMRRAYEKGVVVVSAAGNDGEGGTGVDLDVQPLYPVCAKSAVGTPYVIGVAATDADDKKAPFSHFGSRCIAIAAPGVDLIATVVRSPQFDFTSFYAKNFSGTSFATALVSGAAALLKSQNLALSPSAIRHFLQEGAVPLTGTDPVYGNRMGAGRLDVARSLALARAGATTLSASAPSHMPSLSIAFMNGKEPTRVRIVTSSGVRLKEWLPFSASYRGDIHVTAGDTDGDTQDEVLVSAGRGGGPHVRLFSQEGNLLGQFFGYEASYRGGAHIAVGDPNPDGVKELIVVPGASRSGEARVFSSAGEKQLSFFPFTEEWTDGIHVASGDVDGDGIDDVVFATERSAEPVITVTNIFGEQKFSFHPYMQDVGPLSLALADVDGDGVMEIVTARGEGIPEVRVWKKDVLVANFLAYGEAFRGGVVVAGGDTDGDGIDEIIAVPRSRGGAHVRIFSGEGVLRQQFFAREKTWRGGMEVAVVQK